MKSNMFVFKFRYVGENDNTRSPNTSPQETTTAENIIKQKYPPRRRNQIKEYISTPL